MTERETQGLIELEAQYRNKICKLEDKVKKLEDIIEEMSFIIKSAVPFVYHCACTMDAKGYSGVHPAVGWLHEAEGWTDSNAIWRSVY